MKVNVKDILNSMTREELIGSELSFIKAVASKVLDDLYEEIKHGDEEHQKWLKDKIEEFKKSL